MEGRRKRAIADRPFYIFSRQYMMKEDWDTFDKILVVFGTDEKLDILDYEATRREKKYSDLMGEKGRQENITYEDLRMIEDEVGEGWISFMKETLMRSRGTGKRTPLQKFAIEVEGLFEGIRERERWIRGRSPSRERERIRV